MFTLDIFYGRIFIFLYLFSLSLTFFCEFSLYSGAWTNQGPAFCVSLTNQGPAFSLSALCVSRGLSYFLSFCKFVKNEMHRNQNDAVFSN